jgi:hypothetical protein
LAQSPTQAGAAAPDGPSLADAHAALRADADLQFRFEAATPPMPPGWLDGLLEFLVAISPVLQWVFWGLVAGGAAAIGWLIVREVVKVRLERRAARGESAAAAQPWRPTEEDARALLADADALAAEGRYAEAAHLILLRSIADLRARRPNVVRPALTARDIGRLDALPATARPTFARIAAVVEASRFGGRPVGEAAFADCRRDYEAFALFDGWRA